MMTPPTPPSPILPATLRYCDSLRRFGLEPIACLAGVGARYNRGLWRAIEQVARRG